jgi:hypothetical protein
MPGAMDFHRGKLGRVLGIGKHILRVAGGLDTISCG